jgi:hypothetical protein
MTRRTSRLADFETRSLLLVAGWTLGAAGAAFAQSTAAPATAAPAADPEVTAAFLKADKNGDGKLSKEEAAMLPSLSANYDKADADKDGSISQPEFIKAMKM